MSARRPSAKILRASPNGAFELIVTDLLFAELKRAVRDG
jgi:hypothetical protein